MTSDDPTPIGMPDHSDYTHGATRGHENAPMMHIKVYSPFKTYFDDDGFSISAENKTGPFDILPHHHNFMTLLNACEIIVRMPQGIKKIRISGGLMHVRADRATVFLDI
ncbi:MAG TPA: hypothetical protein VHT70_04540 [Candidatus Saccharimonadales bacterium]|jgi:F0F1-type ATP synthase epsilon subunit|nr:hypothetical protein [Candidatus Saccharimonadales bacterium]